MDGVVRTRVGYAGGSTISPTYYNIGDHTETIDVAYNPDKLSYEKLLTTFWRKHSPTARKSRQYMSVILVRDQEQKEIAEKSLAKQNKVQTQILPLEEFTDAEDYHQKYVLQRHPWLLTALDFDPSQLASSPLATKLNGFLAGCGDSKVFTEQTLPHLDLPEKAEKYIRKNIPHSNLVC